MKLMCQVFVMPIIARLTYWLWYPTGWFDERLFNSKTGWYWEYLL